MKRRELVFIVGAAGVALGLQGALNPASSCGSGGGACGGGHSSHSKQAEETSPAPPPTGLHSGYFVVTKANAFETAFSIEGIRLYRFTAQGRPRLMDTAAGKIEIDSPDGVKQEVELHREVPAEGDDAAWFCPMHLSVIRPTSGACPICGMTLVAQDYLFASVDLSPYLAREISWKVSLHDLGDPEKKVRFTQRGLPTAEADTNPAAEDEPEHVH